MVSFVWERKQMLRIQEGHVQGWVVPAYFPLSSECRILMNPVGEPSAKCIKMS